MGADGTVFAVKIRGFLMAIIKSLILENSESDEIECVEDEDGFFEQDENGNFQFILIKYEDEDDDDEEEDEGLEEDDVQIRLNQNESHFYTKLYSYCEDLFRSREVPSSLDYDFGTKILLEELTEEYDCRLYYDEIRYCLEYIDHYEEYKPLFFIRSYNSEGLVNFLSEKYQVFLDENNDYISSNFMSISTPEIFQPFVEEHFYEVEQREETFSQIGFF
jgi:hypothetical protein